ncbi:MAG: rhomboid family intramembrane serine protease [Sandaracinaceae bacterium]
MRFNFPPLTPLVKYLLVFLGGLFVLGAVLALFDVSLLELLGLPLSYAGGVPWSLAWQALTFWMVYPADPRELVGFVMTLVMLYFFLSPFEQTFGKKRTVILGVLTVLAASAVAIPLAFVVPRPFPLYGASALAAAAFGAFPVLFRDQEIMLFPLLVRMKAWTALLLGIGITALLAVLNRDLHMFVVDVTAIGVGVGYTKWLVRPPKQDQPPKAKRRKGGPPLRVIDGGADDSGPRWLN